MAAPTARNARALGQDGRRCIHGWEAPRRVRDIGAPGGRAADGRWRARGQALAKGVGSAARSRGGMAGGISLPIKGQAHPAWGPLRQRDAAIAPAGQARRQGVERVEGGCRTPALPPKGPPHRASSSPKVVARGWRARKRARPPRASERSGEPTQEVERPRPREPHGVGVGDRRPSDVRGGQVSAASASCVAISMTARAPALRAGGASLGEDLVRRCASGAGRGWAA